MFQCWSQEEPGEARRSQEKAFKRPCNKPVKRPLKNVLRLLKGL
jgi:hypothetical protein